MINPPLQIALCEDIPADAQRLGASIAGSGMPCRCDIFSSGEALLAAFVPGSYDLILLDIYMGGIRGVDAAAEIRKIDRSVTLAFTTTSTEYTLESYRLKAVSYLEKPVSGEDVRELLSLALAKRHAAAVITLPAEGVKRTLPLESILFFELQNHAVTVHTHSEALRVSQTMKLDHIAAMLPGHFFRCHHSYLVNLRYVKELDRDLAIFVMQDGSRVHIRHRDLPKAAKALEDSLFAALRGENR